MDPLREQMDPLGFALENFDAIGAWREKDGRFKIDPAGKLPQGDEFSGPKDLKRILAQKYQDQFLHCLSEKLLTYALGRGVEYYDQCTIDEMVDALKQDGNRFSRFSAFANR